MLSISCIILIIKLNKSSYYKMCYCDRMTVVVTRTWQIDLFEISQSFFRCINWKFYFNKSAKVIFIIYSFSFQSFMMPPVTR